MATCSCGRYEWECPALGSSRRGGMWYNHFEHKYVEPDFWCMMCGDKLLPGGGVESRAELVKKAGLWDRLQAGPKKKVRTVSRCRICNKARDLYENEEGILCGDCARAAGIYPRQDTYKP